LIAAERLEVIATILHEKHVVSIQQLSRDLHVTPMTIRRDLAELEKKGLCNRTHGGAVATGRSIYRETPYTERELIMVMEKRAIARRAAEMVKEGDTIALDSGTTTLQMARMLKEKRHITVITNSIYAILELYCCKDIKMISTAGLLSTPPFPNSGKGDPCLVGPLAEEVLRRFRPSRVFIAASGITLTDGISNSSFEEASMKRAMVEVGAEAILLSDHSKIGKVAAAIACQLSQFHTFITDTGIPHEFENGIQKLGVNLIKVTPEP